MEEESSGLLKHVVVVTGGIGSGKSTVSAMLEDLGAHRVSADELAREIMEGEGSILPSLVQAFGRDILDTKGRLDTQRLNTQRLGDLVFSDPAKRLILEQLTHPEIHRRACEEFRRGFKKQAPLIIYECPLYFEAGLDQKGFAAVVVVTTPEEKCIERVVAKGKLSREQVIARIATQIPLKEKCEKADFVIENDTDLRKLKENVSELSRRLPQ